MGTHKKAIRNYLTGFICFYLTKLGYVRKVKKKVFLNKYITPLFFHNPTRKVFESCIEWLLKNDYIFISTKQLIEILSGYRKPGEGYVWVSLDDGWKDNMVNVIPVVKKYNIPVTFFISTGFIKNSGGFWWSYVNKFKNFLPAKYRDNVQLIWEVEEKERKAIINELVKKFSSHIEKEGMSIEDVKHIAGMELIEIGSHTVNHPITKNCVYPELKYEISESKKDLERWSGKPVISFSYPKGIFNGVEKEILQKYKYCLAATIEPTFITKDTELFYVPRFFVLDDVSFYENICRMVGIWQSLINRFHSRYRTIF